MLARMLIRSLHCSKLQCLSLRGFTSVTPQQVLTPGDVLRKARAFTEEDVLQYSKVSFDSNPLHIESAAAKDVGFKPGAVYVSQNLNFKFPVYIGDEIIGEVQATNLRENRNRYLAKFKTMCFKNGELVVIDGEVVALLPTLTVEQEQHKEP
ncbi:hypothetical protein PHAVU_008G171900 [Phaseolus vulgaris]|uniref:MaoC-like domain-containing protein n=1 Tax=Phaseolus vulgaris TaxID=3885 RepID=V7B6H9_PHAVU|nr:hypothetical protein PHAVU_008G171900g [Phaseolus vulgaris]ESW13150.1 hypothetical protein PHAVU_008G171900g [Phaseolus vulgaris]